MAKDKKEVVSTEEVVIEEVIDWAEESESDFVWGAKDLQKNFVSEKKEQLEQMLAKFEWIHLEKDAVRAIFESLFR